MAYYRPASFKDIDVLHHAIREQDCTEIWHSHGMTPYEGLWFSLERAVEAHSIISDEGNVIGMFGVGEHSPRIGIPWLLATDELPKVAKQFIPESKKWVEGLPYDLLFNYVYANNTTSIRWLRWLNFKFIRKVEFGVNPATFIEFAKLKGA